MSINWITPAQWQTQRWQNGGGITHQICRGDDAQGLLWRLSIAEVASDGPFSRFDNIDRIILLLSGNGFCLQRAGAKPQVLANPLEPFAFAGEAAIHCTLLKGAVRDFNLMTRRGDISATLEVVTQSTAPQQITLSPQTLIYVVSGAVRAVLNNKEYMLNAEHTLGLSKEPGQLQLCGSDAAQVVLIQLQQHSCGKSEAD